MTAGKVKSVTVAASDSADTNFEVIGGDPLSDSAIESLASLLIDIVETENARRTKPITFSKETTNAI